MLYGENGARVEREDEGVQIGGARVEPIEKYVMSRAKMSVVDVLNQMIAKTKPMH